MTSSDVQVVMDWRISIHSKDLLASILDQELSIFNKLQPRTSEADVNRRSLKILEG